jgi:hypothetical protein
MIRTTHLGVGFLLLLFTFGTLGCRIFDVDAPLTLNADRRLELVAPEDLDELSLPVVVEWNIKDFDYANGNKFGIFVDRAPIGPREDLRQRLCSEFEDKPILAGDTRKPCRDDRGRVFFAREPTITFECLEPIDGVSGKNNEHNKHRITVILLDEENNRLGEASDEVRFEIIKDNALRGCQGLPPVDEDGKIIIG